MLLRGNTHGVQADKRVDNSAHKWYVTGTLGLEYHPVSGHRKAPSVQKTEVSQVCVWRCPMGELSPRRRPGPSVLQAFGTIVAALSVKQCPFDRSVNTIASAIPAGRRRKTAFGRLRGLASGLPTNKSVIRQTCRMSNYSISIEGSHAAFGYMSNYTLRLRHKTNYSPQVEA